MTPAELRAARLALGLPQWRMAEALGRSLREYQRWEHGHVPVPHWVDWRVEAMFKVAVTPS